MKERTTRLTTVMLTPTTYQKLKDITYIKKTTISNFLREMIEDYIAQNEKSVSKYQKFMENFEEE